ncbi:hypothetical protein LDENG_00252450 [Lucifuga dentata]|nr:hypothetical protein LDENG_00252450 [Lucifuga dentata]
MVLWIKNVLTDRPQRVCISGTMSDPIVLNTGHPKVVYYHHFYSQFTHEMKMHCNNFKLFKYVDDMALVAFT